MADDVKARIPSKAVLFLSRDAEGVDLLRPRAPGKRVRRQLGFPVWVLEDIASPRRAAPEPRRSAP